MRSDDPDTLLRTHHKLQSAVGKIENNVSSGAVLLDLSQCEEIDPGGLLLVMYAFAQISRREKLSLWYRSVDEVKTYLVENLEHYWDARSKRKAEPSDEFLLRQIKSREKMVQDLVQYADGLRKASYGSDREVAIWETQVGELTTNGLQHGAALEDNTEESQPVMTMVAGKAYAESRVEMGVLDFGAGIPRIIEQVAQGISADGDGKLIVHALKQGVTSRTVPENQGAGLPGVVSAVKENDGCLLLLSGNGLAYVKDRRTKSRKLNGTAAEPILDGTLAIITLPLHKETSNATAD